MITPNDPPHESEDLVAERTVTLLETPEGISMTERDDIIIQHKDEELDSGPSVLTPHQRDMLRQLTRLHRSLAGPQTLLETAGHFNRPPFPPHPRRSR